jgi:hypothetical protein
MTESDRSQIEMSYSVQTDISKYFRLGSFKTKEICHNPGDWKVKVKMLADSVVVW